MDRLICLASASKSRQTVLKSASVRYEINPSSIEEIFEGERPEDYVLKLAKEKGNSVLYKTNADVIVSADSIVVLNNEIIEKPKDYENAFQILSKLTGNTHRFLTGLNVINTQNNESSNRLVETLVTFSKLEEKEVKSYIARFKPYAFAGGYDNSISSWFIDKIEGSISNLMGLPMVELREMMIKFGYHWFDFVY